MFFCRKDTFLGTYYTQYEFWDPFFQKGKSNWHPSPHFISIIIMLMTIILFVTLQDKEIVKISGLIQKSVWDPLKTLRESPPPPINNDIPLPIFDLRLSCYVFWNLRLRGSKLNWSKIVHVLMNKIELCMFLLKLRIMWIWGWDEDFKIKNKIKNKKMSVGLRRIRTERRVSAWIYGFL